MSSFVENITAKEKKENFQNTKYYDTFVDITHCLIEIHGQTQCVNSSGNKVVY